jgi:hypothetical protein
MQDFFKDTDPLSDAQIEFQRVETTLLVNFWQELRTEMDSHQWSEEQGLRYILAAGLAALRNQRQSASLTRGESVLRTAIQQLHNEQANLYGRYAELRHYASELKLTATNLEVQLKACKTQMEILRKMNADLLAGLMNKR